MLFKRARGPGLWPQRIVCQHQCQEPEPPVASQAAAAAWVSLLQPMEALAIHKTQKVEKQRTKVILQNFKPEKFDSFRRK